MSEAAGFPGKLKSARQLGPYPMERLKRVDQPTVKITDGIQRLDSRETGFTMVANGRYGEKMRSIWLRNHPIAYSEKVVTGTFMDVKLLDGEVASQKAPIPNDPLLLSRHIKSLGYFYRADIVGICELPQWALYSHDDDGNPVNIKHKYAIVLVVDQDYNTMHGSNGRDWISRSQSSRGYAHSAMIASMMASYIRKLGFPARAHVFRNELVVKPPLLVLSGIGEASRASIALNPFLGLRYKTSVVTTDLPLQPDKPIDFGLQAFCSRCGKCAVECPSQAISHGDKVMHNGYEIWQLDWEKCLKFRVLNPNGSSCGRCVKVCPWNKPKGRIHNAVRWMAQHTPWMDSFLIKMDDIMGYGKSDERDKWWFDLIEIDGVVQLPEKLKRDSHFDS